MRIRLGLSLALPMIAAATMAAAQEDTSSANWIMPGCRALISGRNLDSQAFRAGICAGRMDILLWVGSSLPREGRFCAPAGVTKPQAAQVAVTYIDRNPGRMHESFAELALMAFIEAWPCPTNLKP